LITISYSGGAKDDVRAKPEPGAQPHSLSIRLRQGRALPHIGRRSRRESVKILSEATLSE